MMMLDTVDEYETVQAMLRPKQANTSVDLT